MKQKLPIAIASILFAVLFNSCYKTGELIYLRKCTLIRLYMSSDKLYNRSFYGAAPNPDLNSAITFESVAGNRRTNRIAEDLIAPTQTSRHETEFSYDNNNNMTQMRWFNWEILPPNSPFPPTAVVDKFVITYPPGTINSVSNSFTIQRFSETFINQVDSPFTYTFNDELQLTGIKDYYNNVKQTFEYDYGGNCTKNTIYGFNNSISAVWEYSNYDDKINPCRTDRTLQLFYHIYSKNNPQTVKLTVYDDKGSLQTYINNYKYTYNSDGYPTKINGFANIYALYDCPIP